MQSTLNQSLQLILGIVHLLLPLFLHLLEEICQFSLCEIVLEVHPFKL